MTVHELQQRLQFALDFKFLDPWDHILIMSPGEETILSLVDICLSEVIAKVGGRKPGLMVFEKDIYEGQIIAPQWNPTMEELNQLS